MVTLLGTASVEGSGGQKIEWVVCIILCDGLTAAHPRLVRKLLLSFSHSVFLRTLLISYNPMTLKDICSCCMVEC